MLPFVACLYDASLTRNRKREEGDSRQRPDVVISVMVINVNGDGVTLSSSEKTVDMELQKLQDHARTTRFQ
jgi:hypothetical protein